MSLAASLLPIGGARAAGEELWVERYQGPETFADGAEAISISPDGKRIFVTGGVAELGARQIVTDETTRDIATVAYSSDGEQLWARVYEGPGGLDHATGIVVSPDGRTVFVVGSSANEPTGIRISSAYVTLAYDTTSGEELWVRRYNPAGGEDGARAVAVSPDGSSVFVTGASEGPDTGYDLTTVAYAIRDGKRLWVAREGGSGTDGASSIAVTADGSRVIVGGRSSTKQREDDRADHLTVSYALKSGRRVWMQRYRKGDAGNALVRAGSDGTVVMSGSVTFGDAGGYTTVAYDAGTGHELWARRLRNAAGAAYVESLALDPRARRAFVTGWYERQGTGWDYRTVAYGLGRGTRLWSAQHGGSGFDGAEAVAVAPDGGSVFVTGGSEDGSNSLSADYATVAYDARTGRELWATRYDGPTRRYDAASGIVVSPDGVTLYVTGWSEEARLAAGYSYATIAYSTK